MRPIFLSSKKKFLIITAILGVILLIVFIKAGIHSASKLVSYLPQNIPDYVYSPVNPKSLNKIKNSYCSIIVDHEGKVSIIGADGKVIVSSLVYYGELESGKSYCGLKNSSVRNLNDSSILIEGNGLRNELVDLLVTTSNWLPKIDVQVRTHYNEKTLVKRESLISSFNIPVSEVYKKNRELDSDNLSSEYWLQNEGVLFRDHKNSALIYHTPLISSLQLETDKKLLFVNLDFDLDHPFVTIPYQPNKGHKWTNVSQSIYKKGSERQNAFSIYIGTAHKTIPRLMLVPSGYKAGYVFTEHADGGTIGTQRAAYFGSDDIMSAKDATGGFVKYKIPVTKSVFYTGPLTLPGATIIEGGKVSPLLNFLDELYATGNYDLCLHTPDDSTSNKKTLAEAIKFMKERYNSICWIDHGFYGGKLNREASVCDGLDSTSPYYAGNLWEEYDTKYFWSPAVEMIKNGNWISVSDNLRKFRFYKAYVTFLKRYASPADLMHLNFFQLIKKLRKNHAFSYELNTLEYNSGSSIPTPMYWRFPTKARNCYFWATDQEKTYGNLTQKDVENEKAQLDNLINHQGVFIDHGYFVRNRRDDRILKTVNGHLMVNPNFDKILSLIVARREKGDLFVTTIKDLLNYWIKLDKIEFQYLPDGSTNIVNNNDESINGLSLIINSAFILVNGRKPSMKASNGQTIFWFNMEPHQTVNLVAK